MPSHRRNVALLAGGQALLLTNGVVLISINGLAGLALAATPSLATLPVTAYVVGGALATLPMSLLMQRLGRRGGFTLGALFGIGGSLLCALAISLHHFWLLCGGNLALGVYGASAQYYRFAAADSALSDGAASGAAGSHGASRAISLVLAGGLLGGVLGPESSKWSKDLLPLPFLGSYVSLAVFALCALGVVRLLKLPPAERRAFADSGRPLLVVARQPVFVVAVLSATVGYAVMNLLMTATPLAMQACHHPYADAAFVIEWHVIGMFAPSFVTGHLIQRFGVHRILLLGASAMTACVAIALSGVDLLHFWFALVLLGVGWNFLYVGGTTLLTEAYRPEERAKAQGLNEVLVFGSMAMSSGLAGLLMTQRGWTTLNYLCLPFLALTVTAVLWLQRRPHPQAPLVAE